MRCDSPRSAELIALIGPPASGKSTLAAALAARDRNVVVLSSDAYRARVSQWGDAADQAASAAAFDLLHIELDEHLAAGHRVVVDATNAAAEHRQALIAIADRHAARTRAIVVLPELRVCVQRNALRDPTVGACGFARQVPVQTIVALHAAITGDSWGQIPSEGWHVVHRHPWRQYDSAVPRLTCGVCGGPGTLVDEELVGPRCPQDCDDGLISLDELAHR